MPALTCPSGTTLLCRSYLSWLRASCQQKLPTWPRSMGPPILSATYLSQPGKTHTNLQWSEHNFVHCLKINLIALHQTLFGCCTKELLQKEQMLQPYCLDLGSGSSVKSVVKLCQLAFVTHTDGWLNVHKEPECHCPAALSVEALWLCTKH